ncbi:hypothetical protein ElyMa_001394300 [Elysia marginata]|uniref:Uncharacterized protein n=1 Tax=Elysia marginata TaxID=1093978 RepID=A0AAV4IX52_9GAST|nr:hypothetical protein ElyMa_001394300 [Elysia marginata]
MSSASRVRAQRLADVFLLTMAHLVIVVDESRGDQRGYRRHNTPPPPAFENPLKVNGGFIAMAAGLSVVVPLVCVLIIQLRRAKREEAERRLAEERARGGGSTSDGGESGTCDLPPSYEQLFGADSVPAAPVLHSRHNSLDMLIEETETDMTRHTSSSHSPPSSSSPSTGSGGVSPITVAAGSSSSGGGNVSVTASGEVSTLGGGPHSNLTFSGSSVSVISETDGVAPSPGNLRNQAADPSLSESEGYVSAPEDNAPVAPSRRRHRQNSEQTGSIDTSNAMSLDSGDFIATLRGQQEQERQRRQLQAQQHLQQQIDTYGDAPPPTYEEALRILAKAKERERSAESNK